MKYSSICCCDSSSQILFRDSTACSGQPAPGWGCLRGVGAYLLPHERLLYRGQVFQGREQHVSVLWPADILDKLAQFLAESCQHLVFIFYRLCASD